MNLKAFKFSNILLFSFNIIYTILVAIYILSLLIYHSNVGALFFSVFFEIFMLWSILCFGIIVMFTKTISICSLVGIKKKIIYYDIGFLLLISGASATYINYICTDDVVFLLRVFFALVIFLFLSNIQLLAINRKHDGIISIISLVFSTLTIAIHVLLVYDTMFHLNMSIREYLYQIALTIEIICICLNQVVVDSKLQKTLFNSYKDKNYILRIIILAYLIIYTLLFIGLDMRILTVIPSESLPISIPFLIYCFCFYKSNKKYVDLANE